jgi:crotonobetainyl-CoA:carnitine CoA-transferase CaiB-like acyl-CoA transferase
VSGPLDGVRVLDLTRLLPGNYCTLLLGDLGAEVVKVEEPGRGDYIRWAAPLVDGQGAAHRALNRGKRSVTLDLKSEEGPAVLRRLSADADAVIESFRPGVLERLGAGYGVLSGENPRLVFCSLTGYGQDGPYRDRAGHDIDYIGLAGILEATGSADGPPVLPAVQVGDFGGGMAAAVAVAAGLREAAVTGRGRFLDVSMLDVAVSWSAVLMSWWLATEEVPARGSMPLAGGLACYRVYRCADGRSLAVGALEPQFWRQLCERLRLPELIEEHLAPPPRQEEIADRLQAVFLERTRDDWARELADLDACVAPVNDAAETARDPQVVHRGMVTEVDGRPVGPGPAVHTGDPPALGPAPGLGEHTEEVLSEAGFSVEEIAGLRARSVV